MQFSVAPLQYRYRICVHVTAIEWHDSDAWWLPFAYAAYRPIVLRCWAPTQHNVQRVDTITMICGARCVAQQWTSRTVLKNGVPGDLHPCIVILLYSVHYSYLQWISAKNASFAALYCEKTCPQTESIVDSVGGLHFTLALPLTPDQFGVQISPQIVVEHFDECIWWVEFWFLCERISCWNVVLFNQFLPPPILQWQIKQ